MNILDTKLPSGWHWRNISHRYRVTKKPKGFKINSDENIPFVPMEAIPLDGKEHVRFDLRCSGDIASGVYFERGDILLSKITPSFENGKQGVARTIPSNFGMASTEIIPLQPIGEGTNRFFLFYYFLHPEKWRDRPVVNGYRNTLFASFLCQTHLLSNRTKLQQCCGMFSGQ